MKVIELLNKIANGEEIPKKIKYQNYIYEYQHRRDTENSFNYMCNENGEYLSRRYFIDNILNEEVEIIEENKKLKHIGKSYNIRKFDDNFNVNAYDFEEMIKFIQDIYDKVEDIIDKINKMEDK